MYKVPPPELQIDFAQKLEEFRRSYLQDALRETVRGTEVAAIDQQLAEYVPADSLRPEVAYFFLPFFEPRTKRGFFFP